MDIRERNRQRAEARLARLPKNSGHARILRAKLGISDAPQPKVEEVSEKIEEVLDVVESPAPKKKKKSRKSTKN
jgi:hypothetical protein